VRPLVLTLGLDSDATAYFERLRRAHFPPDRLVVGAHLTLFHALPGERETEVAGAVRATAGATPPLSLTCSSVLPLGRGTAFAIDGPGLAALHDAFLPLAATAQDRGRRRHHVTVQNKVDPEAAKALQHELAAGFAPFPVRGEALRLWRYAGGPWEHVLDAALAG
jgi:hypothetical protein